MSGQKDTIVIIPAFNEEKSIGLVLDQIPRERVEKIIVVNNNSTDQTESQALAHGAEVIFEGTPGYGNACLKGIAHLKDKPPKNVAFLDGDFSDDPRELSILLLELDRGHDLVIGSRNRGKAQKGSLLPQAIFGNWLATSLLRLFFGGHAFTDLGPFRVIRYQALMDIRMEDRTFGWTVEMQAKALIYRLRCSEIAVSYKQRIGVSKITGTLKGTILAGHKIIQTLFILKFKCLIGIIPQNHLGKALD